MNRRDFLRTTVLASVATAGCSSDSTPESEPLPEVEVPTEPLYRISVAEWSFHRALFAGEFTNLDFAETAASHGILGLEYVNQFFKDKATDSGYLADLKDRADSSGVQSLLIMCDDEGRLGDPDEALRIQAVDNHRRWLDAALTLGCHSIRVNAHSVGTYEEQRDLVSDGLRRMAEEADSRGLNVLVENHGMLSSNGRWLADVMTQVDHPRCGTLPDFGNFGVYGGNDFHAGGEPYDRYLGVEQLMPWARALSAKTYSFDADGNEAELDYDRLMRIALDAGYRGWVGIEYGGGLTFGPEIDGVLQTKRLLERLRDQLTADYAA